MRALVVYESLFGNTEQVAQAISAGLSQHGEVELDRAQAWGEQLGMAGR